MVSRLIDEIKSIDKKANIRFLGGRQKWFLVEDLM